MAVLITVETIVLVLMALLVAGLLRSHAEILRRLDALDTDRRPAAHTNGFDLLPAARPGATPAFDIAGVTLDGDPVKVTVQGTRPGTLLAFLSSGCLQCGTFWEGLRPGHREAAPGDARVVVVTKDPAFEQPHGELGRLGDEQGRLEPACRGGEP